jgi:hypothetical protein
MREPADWIAIAADLERMARDDTALRDRLDRDGSLAEGYHPELRALHDRNAHRLATIIDRHGWPGISRVGARAADAAWLVLHHAIGHPDLQRRGLVLLEDAARRADAAWAQVATLEDRIRVFEGRPQRYGTQFDWDDAGRLSPLPVEDEAGVDARRARMGLDPLSEATARHRASGERPPTDPAARRAAQDAWCREVGWRR